MQIFSPSLPLIFTFSSDHWFLNLLLLKPYIPGAASGSPEHGDMGQRGAAV